MKIPEFNVITKPKRLDDTTTFYEMIYERKLLKTKIKLMHIALFDDDLKILANHNLDIEVFGYPDFHITKEQNLVVPIKNRIKVLKDNQKTILKSYFVYLSYLYQINFFSIIHSNPNYFYNLFFSLNIPDEIKQNFFSLLNGSKAPYFSDQMELLNTPKFRELLEEDKKNLVRVLYKSVKL